MKKLYSKIAFALLISIFPYSVIGQDDLPPEQLAMLEQLPPDQRESIKEKLRVATGLQGEIEQAFEEVISLVKKPELKDLKDQDGYCSECIYGFNFFQFSPSTFAPSDDTPINSSYSMGPGDKLLVNYYGSDEKTEEVFVNREGIVVLPLLGPVNVTGMTYGEASKYIQDKAKSELIGTQINISIREVRSVGVYVLGEAYKPGKYLLSGLSTVTNALFISGGVNKKGSLRNIQIKRDNKTVATYDFYDFLLKGSLDSEVTLQDGDIIFIPFIENSVIMGGAFKRPHRYEFKEGETLRDVVELAGGFDTEVMDGSRIELSTLDRSASTRSLTYLNLAEDAKKLIKDGDVLNVSFTSGLTPQSITLTGEVKNPGEYSIRPGETILEIINRAGGYTDEAYFQGAVFLRKAVAKSQKEAFARSADQLENTIVDVITNNAGSSISESTLVPLSNLITKLRLEEPPGRMVVDLDTLKLKTDPIANFPVKNRDSLFIPERPSFVSIVGEVLNATTVGFNPDLSVDEYIDLAGGLNDAADRDKIFVILPDGKSQLVKRSLFSSSTYILPGSTIVITRDSRPFDAISLTQIITPILADLATSAAAIAAISD
ncbi:MAG: SLBB domain-containing protein [Pseudomonadota bacterium]|nr:SLBB domain-containing protein [Pseudomonadota bacterium]|tara:strand:- start:3328 stop:5133 length:1806 start_codon:yes stop_codon:yes gene_type:complete